MMLTILGWYKYTQLYVTVSELNGDHFSIIESPEELVRIIAHALQKMVGKSSSPPKEFYEKLLKVAEEGIKQRSYVTSEPSFFSSHKNGKAKPSAVVSEVLSRAVIPSKL